MGLLHLAAKQMTDAEKAFQTAALKDPVRATPYLELGRLYEQRGEKARALEAFRHALRLDPMSTTAMIAADDLSASLEGGS
jgi:cytochrome c-type biogenesis protein CcmH/NrfG